MFHILIFLHFQLDEKEILLNKQKKESSQKERKLRTQLSQEKERRKRSYEEEEFRGVNSRVAEMEAKLTVTTKTKKYRV